MRGPIPIRAVRGASLAGAVLAAVLVTARPPLVAQTGVVPDGDYQLIAHHSGKCLEVAGGSTADEAPVQQSTCNAADQQTWHLTSAGNGYYHLVATHSGKLMDVQYASTADAAGIIQWPATGGMNQDWHVDAVAGAYYQLTARHSGKVLDISGVSQDDGARAIQWPANGGLNQQWTLKPVATAPPEAPSVADTIRFLEQSTWGPTPALIAHVREIGFSRFLDEQFALPASSYPTLPLYPSTRDTVACPNGSTCQRDNYTLYLVQNRFFTNALYGDDQLRQRVAFALHQIIVVSGVDITLPAWMTPYLQVLDRNAFGNYRQLLYEISLNAAMGNYLDINNNTRTRPNENYARELLQLFSIGTVQLNPDGTQQLDGAGQPVPTYTQTTIDNFARVFTGWRFATAPATGVPNYIDPMVANEAQHDVDPKTLLDGRILPKNQTTVKDLNDALDNIFAHPNLGPFIAKQLIVHLVTSNPSPAYVARVAAVFNGAAGARGDMPQVIRAILLDPEARGDVKTDANYGRLRNPLQFITNMLRAFDAKSADASGPSDGYLAPQGVNMGMDLFRPPSVFSYYSPSGGVPGAAGVRGPEFGILSTSTAIRRANFVNTMVFSRIAVGANSPLGTSLDFTRLLPLAATPSALVDALDELLLHKTMSQGVRDNILTAVNAVAATNTLKRVRTAAYLVLSSSQYQVER